MVRLSACIVIAFCFSLILTNKAESMWLRRGTPKLSTPLKLKNVSVRMKWFYAGTMAGWFAGKEYGFFSKEGLDLKIYPGGPGNNSVKLVAAGTDTFGVAGADEVLMAREKGIPVVAIAVLFKSTPVCFISKKEKGITSPSQWAGRTVEVIYGRNEEVQYRALLNRLNVKGIKEVPYAFNLAPLLEDRVDISVAYRMDQVVTLESQGVHLDIISPKEFGVDPYGDVVITTEKTLRKSPELVECFVRATVNSFRWSIEHPEEAVGALIKYAPHLKADNELKVWKATIPFITGDGGISDIGVMSLQRWQETRDILIEFGFLNGNVNLKATYHNMLQEGQGWIR